MNDTLLAEINVPDPPIEQTIFVAHGEDRSESQCMETLCCFLHEIVSTLFAEVSIFAEFANDLCFCG